MKRSKFSLSHYKIFTCKMGVLVPVTWFEVLPGDTIQHSTSGLIRCAPLVTPAMHPVRVRFHTFFVPNRILWSNWEAWITGGDTGSGGSNNHPNITINAATEGTLHDYLGVPHTGSLGLNCNALPYRAYANIWNEWYRDTQLQTALTINTGNGLDSTTNTTIQNVCWEKDYLTASRGAPELGGAVSLFGGGSGQAPIRMTTGATSSSHVSYPGVPAQGTNTTSTPPTQSYDATTDTAVANSSWAADLTNTGIGLTVANLRHAFALERFEEARNVYGSRYTEYLRYLGVRSSDARLQRPELLSSGRQIIQFSEVLQTGVTTSGTGGGAGGVGQFGGHGISGMRSNRYRRFFEEHGIVMTLMSVVPKSIYTNALERKWLRGIPTATGSAPAQGLSGTREDYWQRELERIGQQGISNFESDGQASDGIFGYQDRYSEYRSCPSSIAGLFRTTLNTWTFGRSFGSAPALNSTFVSCVPPTTPFADTTDDNLYCMVNHNIQARRLLRHGSGVNRVL